MNPAITNTPRLSQRTWLGIPDGSPKSIPICDCQLAAISIIVGSDVSSVSIATIVMHTIVTINTLPRWRNHELKANGRSGLSSWRFFNRQLAATNHSITATTPSTNAGSKRVGESNTGSADAAACSTAKIMASHHVARNIFLKFPVYSW